LIAPPADAGSLFKCWKLDKVNQQICGQVLDFTCNHGYDRRIWSPALCQKRDLYVYLPPGYDPSVQYPLGILLHGAMQDEQFFFEDTVFLLDRAMACGELAPIIVVVPDGSICGRSTYCKPTSAFANTRAGRFEDFIMCDVWNFALTNFPIRPEREARALLGISMGGSAAFAHAIKYKDRVGTAIGIMPPVNLRWVDCCGRYRGNFDPCCWGWRSETNPHEVFGRKCHGLIGLHFSLFLDPLVGRGPDAIAEMSRINPIEMLERYNIREGELNMFIAYGGKDEFNIDAQCESFLCFAKERGLTVGVAYDPEGRHDSETGVRFFPEVVRWVAPRVAPFAPPPRK